MEYFAHSTDDSTKSNWQLLKEHSLNVAKLSEKYAGNIPVKGVGPISEFLGLMHDSGKYARQFQKYISGESNERFNHASAGAIVSLNFLEKKCKSPSIQNVPKDVLEKIFKFLVTSIACHHTGLVNGSGDNCGHQTVVEKLTTDYKCENIDDIQKELLSNINKDRLLESIISCIKEIKQNNISIGFSLYYLQQYLFSILVDSDYSDTASFYGQKKSNEAEKDGSFSWSDVYGYIYSKISELNNDSEISQIRQGILSKCIDKAEHSDSRIFSLRVPTGGGKTLSSLAFAAKYAERKGQSRFIYVAPYTSIIEQNAEVYRKFLGDYGNLLLEHHCSFDFSEIEDEKKREFMMRASETWDTRFIVTTAVQFFETLFSAKSSVSRKRHNIANSVIIIDEFQNIPVGILRPTLAVIEELSLNYNCAVVLATATMPPVCNSSDFYNGLTKVEDIIDDSLSLFESLKRVSARNRGEMQDDAVVKQILDRDQILVVVNTKEHANKLFKMILDKSKDSVFVLTTYMCPSHRKDVLNIIRQKLSIGDPCRVISTSLIEAGVDIDFPYVLREIAGLDSIAQAAGRCNREGKLPREDCFVDIFESSEYKGIQPKEIKTNIESTKSILACDSDDILSPTNMKKYFTNLYKIKGDLDKKNILSDIEGHSDSLLYPYLNISQNYKIVDTEVKTIYVSFNEEAYSLINQLKDNDIHNIRQILRRLQKYSVQLTLKQYESLVNYHRIEFVNEIRFNKNIPILIGNDMYDMNMGLNINLTNLKIENLII